MLSKCGKLQQLQKNLQHTLQMGPSQKVLFIEMTSK